MSKQTLAYEVEHNHHIIPEHLGGSNDSDNILRCSTMDHAIHHWLLYIELGNEADRIAAKGLEGLANSDECAREAMILGAKKVGKANVESGHLRSISSNGAKANWEKNKDKITETLRKNAKLYGHLGGQPKNKWIWVTDGETSWKVEKWVRLPAGVKRGRARRTL